MHELVGNMHIHTPYSDGVKYHQAIAEEALAAQLDFIIVTDHNIWLGGLERYVQKGEKRLLLLIGEEIHDNRREPQCNHLLVYGAEGELSPLARHPQALIDGVNEAGGFAFLAHPDTYAFSLFGGCVDLGWHSWEVTGYVGMELWNYMSSFTNEIGRSVGLNAPDTLLNRLRLLPLAFEPDRWIDGPEPATLARWDALLARGQKVAVIGNSDAHGTIIRLGPIEKEIYPYEFLFRAVNTHILTPTPLTGDLVQDKRAIYQAVRQGHGWVGYDLIGQTRGFRFTGRGVGEVMMGDELILSAEAQLQVQTPLPCELVLLCNGERVAELPHSDRLTYRPKTPGAYRLEAYLPYKGKKRGWIFSNPIYVRSANVP